MRGPISKETATAIAFAYREIETGEALLAKIEEGLANRSNPDIRDAFGRQRNLQLGVPSSDNGHRLFDLPWNLAKPVIEAHIAQQRAIVATLSDKAVTEVENP